MRIEHKPPDADHPAGGTSSPLDELRDLYTAIDDDQVQTEVFDVPGSNVAVRYRRISFKEVTAALTSDGDLWERNAQLLIDACDEILIRVEHEPKKKADPPTVTYEPLVPGERVTFDLRLGESIPLHQALGVKEPDVRRSVLRIFQGVDQELLNHAVLVDHWIASIQRKTSEKFQQG